MGSWVYVTQEVDTAQFLRDTDGTTPLTSPRFDDLDEATQRQVTLAVKSLRGLVKAGVVSEGKVRISASGHLHHDPKMSTDPNQADFVAFHIGRVI